MNWLCQVGNWWLCSVMVQAFFTVEACCVTESWLGFRSMTVQYYVLFLVRIIVRFWLFISVLPAGPCAWDVMWHQIDNLFTFFPFQHSNRWAIRVYEVHLKVRLDAAFLAQYQWIWVDNMLSLPVVLHTRVRALFDTVSLRWGRDEGRSIAIVERILRMVAELLMAENLTFIRAMLWQYISNFWIHHLISTTQLPTTYELLLRDMSVMAGW